MKPASRTARARKAMRVATVFTGAAAVATFGPSALAGTGHAAPRDGRTATHHPNYTGIHTMDRIGKVFGSIRKSGCAGKPNWVHINGSRMSPLGEGIPDTNCFGFYGEYDVSSGVFGGPWSVYYECGGNNSGLLNPTTANEQSYRPGTTYRNEHNYQMNSIYNLGWSKNDKCASNPPGN
jgi:hypothetical protein